MGTLPTATPPLYSGTTEVPPAARAEVEARRSALLLTGLFVAAVAIWLPMDGQHLLRNGFFVVVVSVLFFVLIRSALTPTRPIEAEAAEAPGDRPATSRSAQLEALGRVSAGLAHDVNNVLASVACHADLALLRTAEGDPAREDLLAIRHAAERGACLTRKVLELGRPSPARPDVLDLNSVLVDLGRILPRLMGASVEIEVVPAPRPALVHADLTQIEQILLNLALNARDALPHGGHLVLRADVSADAGADHVQLEVTDDGVGMDETTRARIFEPFFTTREEGTGLGLSLVADHVRALAGSIRCESSPGRGTTFRIRLPRVAGTPVAAAEAALPVRGGNETLLLVEDDVELRAVLERVLGAAGYRVLAARSTGEALELAGRPGDGPRLLVADVVLPGRSGVELAGRLAPMPAVFLSGHDAATLARMGAPAGVLAKPFSTETLLARVRAALDATAPAARPAPPPPARATVLVVDDDAAFCDVAARLLEAGGHEARIALGGDQALATLQRVSVDVVVCDMLMPDGEGLETIRVLRQRQPSLPIVAMSGAPRGESYTGLALKLGAVATLRKPFTGPELLDAVGRALVACVPPPASQETERV